MTAPGLPERWASAVARWRLAVLAAALALTAASLYLAATGLRIDTDTAKMIADDAPYKRDLLDFRRAFPQLDDNLVLVLDGAEAETVDGAAEALAAALGERPEFEEVWLPGGAAFFRTHGMLYLDRAALDAVLDRAAAAAPLLTALAQRPTMEGLFGVVGLALSHAGEAGVSEDSLARLVDSIAEVAEAAARGQPRRFSWAHVLPLGPAEPGPAVRVVLTRPTLDYASLRPAALAMAAAREEAGRLGIDGAQVRLRLTGEVALEADELGSAERGGKRSGALSLVLVLVLLGLGLRSAGLTLATLLTLVAGLAWTAGFAALAIGHLNLISVAFAVLFVGLGVDFSIHYCLRYREELGHGDGRTAALARAARGTGRGLAIAAAGAGIGFYAFLPTAYRGFAELGLISGTSMFIALAATFTLLPALLACLPAPRAGDMPRRTAWRGIERFVTARHRTVLALSLLALLAGSALLPRLEFDFEPLNLKDPESESFTAFQTLAADPRNAVGAAEILAADAAEAARLAARLEALPEVASTRRLESFVPADQAAKLETVAALADVMRPALEATPDPAATDAGRAQAAARLLQALRLPRGDAALGQAMARLATALEPMAGAPAALADLERRLLGGLPDLFARLGQALEAEAFGIDDLPEEIRRHWVAADRRRRLQALPAPGLEGNAGTERFVTAVLAAAPRATGAPVATAAASGVVTTAFLQATLTAVVAIALLLLALYRRPALLALTLGPLALAAVLTLATSVAIGLPLNFANVIVLPLLFGLGMASAVHLVERERQLAPGQELMATTTPRAVLFSTLTTLASFGSLGLSAHRGMASMGVLLTVAILYTLLCTLVVLPSLMAALARWTAPR